jgi:phytanoyl-CoA hydroxylase
MSATDAVRHRDLTSAAARRAYYFDNGYVVREQLINRSVCRRAIECFRHDIKSYNGYLYRQASANPERNIFDCSGNILNSLLNPLSVNGKRFPAFRAISEEILSQRSLFDAVSELISEPAVLVQSMYFEANPATWPHQDCYYLDDDSPGRLLGAWIALEDIAEEAGRFYVAPGSHRREIGRNVGNLGIARNHERYKQLVRDTIESESIELHAPALKCGDVLFWNSRTIHGAFPASNAQFARNSYTAHFIPASSRLMQFQCIPITLKPESRKGAIICRPKDQDSARNRWILALETCFPASFQYLKKQAISWKLRRSRRVSS